MRKQNSCFKQSIQLSQFLGKQRGFAERVRFNNTTGRLYGLYFFADSIFFLLPALFQKLFLIY